MYIILKIIDMLNLSLYTTYNILRFENETVVSKKGKGTMMKKVLGLFLTTIMVCISVCGCGNADAAQVTDEGAESDYQKIELVMAVNGTDIQIDSKVAKRFADLVEEESGGNVTIVVFPNDQLAGGNATKGVEMVTVGGVDLAAYATCVMAVVDDRLSVATIPWTFDNYTEARTVIDETGGDYYAKVLADKGMTYLGSFHNGFRQISNSKHMVKTPEDVKGLKIRVPGSEVYMDFFRAFGADPVAMSWSEVFTAIQQGTIDGQENGVCITQSAKMNEIQDYITLWNYSYENDLIVANSKIWESLEPKTRELLNEKAIEACEWGRDLLEMEEENIVKEFEMQGIEVTKLSGEELEPFKEKIIPLKDKFKEKYGSEACESFGIE